VLVAALELELESVAQYGRKWHRRKISTEVEPTRDPDPWRPHRADAGLVYTLLQLLIIGGAFALELPPNHLK